MPHHPSQSLVFALTSLLLRCVMPHHPSLLHAVYTTLLLRSDGKGQSQSKTNPLPSPVDSDIDNFEITEDGKRKKVSVIWNHFKRKIVNGEDKTMCNYCSKCGAIAYIRLTFLAVPGLVLTVRTSFPTIPLLPNLFVELLLFSD
ncbi:hypothetical protein Fmac_005856 [Flemingia macrophylla]|uniref:BED-type domain-containing protein n=1 Tax=Flemingia macrophylla TaxID=520843 RepID=A0ABD1N8Z6_9FABA